VDAADYVAWRDGAANPQDYETWKANFGAGASAAGLGFGAGTSAAVPEPTGLILVVIALAASMMRSRSDRVRLGDDVSLTCIRVEEHLHEP
jgi:hypothetical protein